MSAIDWCCWPPCWLRLRSSFISSGAAINRNKYNKWNHYSIDFCMMLLIFKYNIINDDIKKQPITLKMYNSLKTDVDNFLQFYEKNNYTDDMYPYNIIYNTFNMIKNNDDLKSILSLWNTRLNYLYDADGNCMYDIKDDNIIGVLPFTYSIHDLV